MEHGKGLVFSFKHFDRTQGQNFEDWESNQLLSKMLNEFHGYCLRPHFAECLGSKFTVYGKFPGVSKFKHPKQVPPDADWTRIHIQGEPCVIGHMFQNIFYVVFLDREHQFWPSAKKHT
jgi:hypothetical protein